MGERDRLRRDEAHRRANRRRNDHLDDARPHTCASVLRDHEGAGIQEKRPALRSSWLLTNGGRGANQVLRSDKPARFGKDPPALSGWLADLVELPMPVTSRR